MSRLHTSHIYNIISAHPEPTCNDKILLTVIPALPGSSENVTTRSQSSVPTRDTVSAHTSKGVKPSLTVYEGSAKKIVIAVKKNNNKISHSNPKT